MFECIKHIKIVHSTVYMKHSSHREARQNKYRKETEQLLHRIRNRGDQRIGQLLLNAVKTHSDLPELYEPSKPTSEMSEKELSEALNKMSQAEAARKAKVQNILWEMEAGELLEALKTLESETMEESSA